ncbi:ganglioside-induced differentiation-associated protein 1-like [Lingula anatina]|uniref:Ganglioside-induced differentiation-associated protein 1-like n=1 Tax=Lingula anatina TaxID=7574 RepID=A0A1S3I9H6_LINAN|nr:ganglioside-induced differentiation-associated protein 1-like [Lingula anatina]|eukprot:XP_013394915.1 ganglioside-induced differentiation-associated protein 1-like [Lingula anatina]
MADDELTVLYNPGSFYSQKVALYLKERNISFNENIINLAGGETYKPWFLRINPEGQVPVLKHQGKYIPDSKAIMDYLEKAYDSSPKLLPPTGSDEREKVQRLSELISSVEIEVITFGMMIFPHYTQEGHITGIIARLGRWRASKMGKYGAGFEKLKAANPDLREAYSKKAAFLSNFVKRFNDEATVKEALEKAEKVFDEIEDELRLRDIAGGDWLCGPAMTVADIHLAVLFGRLNFLGLRHRYWENGRRPNTKAYYLRLKKRDTYRSVCEKAFNPITMMLIPMLRAKLPLIIGVSTIVAAVAVGFHIWRRGDLDLEKLCEKLQFWKN